MASILFWDFFLFALRRRVPSLVGAVCELFPAGDEVSP
jgi:hypothetical protein